MVLLVIIAGFALGSLCNKCSRTSVRYPLIEIFTAIIMLLLYRKYGATGSFFAYGILISILIVVSLIDLELQIIPNALVAIGALVGIISVFLGWTVDWEDAVLGLLAGGGTLLLISLSSLAILKKEGMGGGDVKLMGMLGLFLGWKMVFLALMLAVYAGGIASIFLLLLRIKKPGQSIPFGPFISLGAFVAIIWGNQIMSWYINCFIGG